MAELRELVTELRETVQAQQDKLSLLSDQLADLQRSRAGARPPPANAARLPQLSLTLQMQMEQATAQVARQTVAELAADLVRRHPKLEMDLLLVMQQAVAPTGREVVREIARGIA
ncbi:hypothetical protein [Nonomuraea indica]|uniref:hypothetical protein n=1 Tax=Nonomuraea indica TaxID=1581193 RepID=UPI000C7E5361|nr:hypothetical protein [Nonomuraea indica]